MAAEVYTNFDVFYSMPTSVLNFQNKIDNIFLKKSL